MKDLATVSTTKSGDMQQHQDANLTAVLCLYIHILEIKTEVVSLNLDDGTAQEAIKRREGLHTVSPLVNHK